MNKILVLALGLLSTSMVQGQVWDQMPESLTESSAMLNPSFIKDNGIGLIVKEHQQKAPNRPIISTGIVEEFYFDIEGRLIRKTETDAYGRMMKEVDLIYRDDQLHKQITTTGNRVLEQKNIYEAGHLSGEVWRAWSKLRPGDTTTVKALKIEPKAWNDTTMVYQYSHADGRPIYQRKHVFDNNKYLLSIDTKYQMGGRKDKSIFGYNHMGQVDHVAESRQGKVSCERSFEYDNLGLLQSIREEKADAETLYEFVYDDAMLPKAVLFKEGETVMIKKYQVTLLKDLPLRTELVKD